MSTQSNQKRQQALHTIMGTLLDHDIRPDVCRIFSPSTFDTWHWGATLAYMAERGSLIPPAIGMKMGMDAWKLENVLPAFIAQVMQEHPDAAPRDHLVGGFFALALAPWIDQQTRDILARWTDPVVHMTTSSEVANRLPDRGRVILAAYDRALAKVAAWDERFRATDEGADE